MKCHEPPNNLEILTKSMGYAATHHNTRINRDLWLQPKEEKYTLSKN